MIFSDVLPRQLAGGMKNTPIASLQRVKTPAKVCLGYDTKQSDGCGSSNAGALGNAEYPFIAIAPRSTFIRSDSTW